MARPGVGDELVGCSFESVMALVGCDKTLPGAAMALFRLGLPGLILYGGSIGAGAIDEARLERIEAHACPGPGACGGQYTANTMALVLEGTAVQPADRVRRPRRR